MLTLILTLLTLTDKVGLCSVCPLIFTLANISSTVLWLLFKRGMLAQYAQLSQSVTMQMMDTGTCLYVST